MKRYMLLSLLILVAMSLSACSKVEAIEDVDIAEYTVLHAEDDFVIFVVRDIPTDQIMPCLVMEHPDYDFCCLGLTAKYSYIVRYDDKYISLWDGFDLELYTTPELMEYGVLVSCHNNGD
ncbi:MAG: hypothetical protein WC509_00990 [Candidatus Izemoplasmatales bacterium]